MNELQVMCLMYVVIITLLIIGAVKEIREVLYDMFDLLLIIPSKKIYKSLSWIFDKSRHKTNNQLENPIENYTSNNLELRIINSHTYDEHC